MIEMVELLKREINAFNSIVWGSIGFLPFYAEMNQFQHRLSKFMHTRVLCLSLKQSITRFLQIFPQKNKIPIIFLSYHLIFKQYPVNNSFFLIRRKPYYPGLNSFDPTPTPYHILQSIPSLPQPRQQKQSKHRAQRCLVLMISCPFHIIILNREKMSISQLKENFSMQQEFIPLKHSSRRTRPPHRVQILSKSLRQREGLLQKCSNNIEKKERKYTSFHKDSKKQTRQPSVQCIKQKVRSLLKQCSQNAIIHKTKQLRNKGNIEKFIVQWPKTSTKHSQISDQTNCSIEIQNIQGKRKEYKVLHFASKVQAFQVIKFIDSGSFGEVYLVRHLITNMVFCLKSLKKSQFNEESIHQLIREIKIQSYANHPNIIKVYGYAFDTENVYILMEACLGKNLYHYIQRQLLPEEKVKNYMQQLSSALAYLHKNNIIHRDVKPENVLVDGDLVKLCDFGWAIHSPLMRGTRCGTPLYTPPEMIKQEMYDNKVDVWCLGVLTYQLLFGTVPFEIRSLSDISKIVSDQISFPKSLSISAEAIDFVKGCLQKQSQRRLSIRQVIDHQFLLTKTHLNRQTFP